ncbi:MULTISPECIES: CmpA/NrtA family ABC transporter substrate-binding protein [unclassified Beijerinckia]|uniref:CmpA/NrtA family ABC transporter substrate-binding protein n=1 Tax=unclassified Beijerinckia TaxID=2638183 RepID=UPI00089CF216|nr:MULTISPECIES: CmpA/NrtA family ABC transporter substrate-binding protein [unclassified Beijerinckia]MDH7795378.1 ABC-type nitrate/sulfonate/bicarbonate transport system substrate-binding protein [Beijerinckia sp. GAS462]SEB99105.1 NitT/TauT family transport system ATP-binding protein [Beijerinckia sp. 28-YEA-48]
MKITRLRIGYIPLVDAAALLVAADCGFAQAEGLEIELVREVSWSNVRDKLNLGLLDAAHLLSPLVIASSLGLGHVRVPIITPFNLALNANAITISPQLHAALSDVATGDLADPHVSARALAQVVADRKARGAEPLNFGMTFPFSNHNYQLRFWMAAGGVDPDEDVRLVVLPPPYMVESLASGHVDGFCVGAPWNLVAVDAGVGHILHLGYEIMARVSEKVLAMRERWANDNPAPCAALIRALMRAADMIGDPAHRTTVADVIAARIDVTPDLVARVLAGTILLSPNGPTRNNPHHIIIGGQAATRPDPVQAAWFYAQLVRWGQAPLSDEMRERAVAAFRTDLYDEALGTLPAAANTPSDRIGAFAGPEFNPVNIQDYLNAWRKPSGRPRLSVVR